ncbi:MAG: hypothetical protein F4Y26_00525 [Gammaproteobacteria bacterium]|nr:hypothetical protein [Gammaproteobacteria bacterium]
MAKAIRPMPEMQDFQAVDLAIRAWMIAPSPIAFPYPGWVTDMMTWIHATCRKAYKDAGGDVARIRKRDRKYRSPKDRYDVNQDIPALTDSVAEVIKAMEASPSWDRPRRRSKMAEAKRCLLEVANGAAQST